MRPSHKCARHGCPDHRAKGSVWCAVHQAEADASEGGVSLTCDNLPALDDGDGHICNGGHGCGGRDCACPCHYTGRGAAR